MPARNRKSMERESEAEPVDLLILLRHAHREIKLLLKEMEDILDLPAAIFELYPRIQVALQAHDAGEKYCLYAAMRDIPEFSDLLTMAESEHAEIDRMLDVLNHTPFRKQQLDSPEWKHKFRELHRKVLDHLSREEGEIFPLLQTLLAQSRLDALGDRYKRGLKGELGPPPARSEVIA
jgi:hemerythrin superfamily protein